MARGTMPSSIGVNLLGQPIRVGRPRPNPNANFAQSATQMQYSPAILYHYQNWSTASGIGSNNYQFFGASIGNNGSTPEDTNMLQPNNVGAGNTFIVGAVFVDLKLGEPLVTAAAEGTLITTNALTDYQAIMNRGFFQMQVNNVPQFGNGISPLKKMADPCNVLANLAVSTGSGDTTAVLAATPYSSNSGWMLGEDVYTFNDQTPFSASVAFPAGALTLPSGNNTTKIGVVLKGWWFRPAG